MVSLTPFGEKVGLLMFVMFEHKSIEKLERLVKDKTITTAIEMLLVLTIARHAWSIKKKQNSCMKSIDDLIEITGSSRSSIRRALRVLRDANVIDFQYRTRIMGQPSRITKDWKKSEAQMKRGAKQLRNYYTLRDAGIATRISTLNTPRH